ncbi:MAG: hydroxysqualene dehydroxylase HpnE [Acidobacteria bacterium]|nr:hydroxysqualene dehydroxylase HpnE [Acidobacteriota bacterium]
MADDKYRVVIIGGGFAGLSAGVDLAEQGWRVLVLEKRGFLGGRAYSFIDKTTGDSIDNGQHLLMGCYHHTLRFLEKIGSISRLKMQLNPQVDFLLEEANGYVRQASFKCPRLPAPLHLLAGLAGLETIDWRERLLALRVGLALRRVHTRGTKLADTTVREWLNNLGQPERMQRRFWDVIALATLNESPERASADMFARVLDQAFLRARRDSLLIVSQVPLSELYTEQARNFIEARGGEVRLNSDVLKIEFDGSRVCNLTLRSGETIEVGAVISAVPYYSLRRLLTDDVVNSSDCFRSLEQFRSSPIVSINLWYSEPITDLEFVGLLDSPIEWVFNKNAIAGVTGIKRQHLALVISGAHGVAQRPNNELLRMAVSTIERFFPAARRRQLIHSLVVREQDATLSHTIGTARMRPPQKTNFSNFYLAGDWTDTGLPATIEGAVWSGQECARMVSSH